MIKKLLQNSKIKFLIVGGYNTVFNFFINNLSLALFRDELVVLALIIVYPINLIHNFFTFKVWVFKSETGFFKGVIRLNNSYIISYLIQLLLTCILVYIFQLNDNLSFNLVFPFMVVWQYFLHTRYTFR